MKVLMTVDTVGGVWTYALELTRALAALDGSVVLASMGARATIDQRAQVAALPNATLLESDYALEWMDDPWMDVARAGDWLLEIEAREAPDVVHLNGYALGARSWSAPVCIVAHSCVLSWWRAVRGGDAPARWDVYRAAVRGGLRHADAVVAPTAAMLRSLAAYHVPLSRAVVIPNGRDPSRFVPGTKEPFVVSVGRLWDDGKNIAALARVAPALPWPVYVAGALDAPAGTSGSGSIPGLHWLGSLTEPALAGWMSRASVFALPARYEPFGLAPLEAALAGCALVLGDLPSLREVWGDAAVYVPPEDDAALRAAVVDLATHDGVRQAMAARARARAARYAPERMARRYIELYDALRAQRASAGAGTGEREGEGEGTCAS